MSSPNLPVSAWLGQRVLTLLKEKKIVVWLDADGHYTGFVDRLAETNALSAPVFPFRGSFLELMLASETAGSTIDKPPMLFHVPGFNTASIRRTPAAASRART